MSTRALFPEAGLDVELQVPKCLAALPRGEMLAAQLVYCAIDSYRVGAGGGCLLDARYNDRVLQQSRWLKCYSRRTIQKGLRALERIGVIQRHRRRGKGRTIVVMGPENWVWERGDRP